MRVDLCGADRFEAAASVIAATIVGVGENVLARAPLAWRAPS